jgi:2,3-bisphosphoglycerate-independent phosphoglycerate mutase
MTCLPEMSARAVADAVIDDMERVRSDFILLNFANSDMVEHTGDLNAAARSSAGGGPVSARGARVWRAVRRRTAAARPK